MPVFRTVAADITIYSVVLGLAGVGICAVGGRANYESTIYADFLKASYEANVCIDDADASSLKKCETLKKLADNKSQAILELDRPPNRLRRGWYIISRR